MFVQWVRLEERKAARYDAQLDAELVAGRVDRSGPAAVVD